MLLGPGEIPVLGSHHAGQTELDVSSASRAGIRHHGRPETPGKAGQATANPRPHSSMSTNKRPGPAVGIAAANALPQPRRRSQTPRDPEMVTK